MYFLLTFAIIACTSSHPEEKRNGPDELTQNNPVDTATFAGGCFWCVEASFEQIKGVYEAVSGYSGGSEASAKYELVAVGETMHAEAVQVYFNPEIISYETLLEIFFTAHDPTQLNRQGPDIGPQYRSAIFYHSIAQKEQAEKKIKEIQPSFGKRIVTELVALDKFYKAEAYHQDYEERNPYQPYIVSVSRPKINKVKEKFAELLKEEYK